MKFLRWCFAAILAVAALYLVVLGAKLAGAGGSWYYALTGLGYLVAAYLIARQDRRGAGVVLALLLVTLIWSFWEVGTDYWGWFPRLLAPLGFAIAAALLFSSRFDKVGKGLLAAGVVGILAFGGFLARGFINVPYVSPNDPGEFVVAESDNAPLNWTAYSRDTMGTRYSPFTQINRENVGSLELAWTYETGRDETNPWKVDQNTPLQIDNTLYSCTPENVIHAIDATTGEGKWTYDPKADAVGFLRCRGLGYHLDADTPEDAPCHERIIGNTIDARLFELDAATGALCEDFGTNGEVDLRDRMVETGPQYYFQTSAPLVANDKIIVGGWIADNQAIGEPSGAVRAFDVRSGALLWAWDPGAPETTAEPTGDETTYTLGTPNMWTHAAYDPELDMIYAPMGSAGTDYWLADRPEQSRPYNTAIVALNGATGRPVWHYQTVHDDLWDLDLPSQPALIDMKNDAGEMVPALVLLTKRGEIFTFDRRDGTTLTEIEERPVATTGGAPDITPAPTQPYSVGMPNFSIGELTEAKSWGMTMFDQLTCRIAFRQQRWDGEFTPPGTDWALEYPAPSGGFNWGSASYDPVNRLLFVNDMQMVYAHRLIPREEYTEITKTRDATPDGHSLAPMQGTPYGHELRMWASALGVPCTQPPLGTVTAIDMDTREIAWQVASGTASELGPLGMKLGLPMTMGMPSYAGTTVTAGGLVFFAGTQDYFLRAYDAATGEELLKMPLPVGASATPMVYVSPENGKEYVLLSVGGSAQSPVTGDYLMAFTLPD
ncbi:membrane-bound PQQ-dependent dehydrogenase, glucose/quinate/shikimate family [Salipiger mangrovisoli]|uniref:Membrane-bound PQQ-dependent dehydrogenase, glucose/quinate/shikimate family n=1 Tax=Salipiger mangrovisoli TaxID=2865933 RepID=A0ABR9X9D2_9RHOB|nr:membrane-bound PQQ-dependent dehydrogenase, glucose/quinate/shikimate family [Salipiger mangrovisoli]MBE9640046.1 membrane-bound PQQ-dependent dehydrogenase, glucose/quinate/shikimate family [Salipiger mangrovisoli]